MRVADNKRRIIINEEKLETRVALVDNCSIEEYRIERKSTRSIVGSVFYGKIVNIQMSLMAVFIDIGIGKNAFMHFADMLPATYEDPNIKTTKSKSPKVNPEDIPKLFPVGSMLFVQVTKGSIGTKGPRATTNISIPGRNLVFLPYSDHIGISKKIEDDKERSRLRDILLKLPIPNGMGCICRTIAEGKKSIYFKREITMLLEIWSKIEQFRKISKIPSIAYQESALIEKSMRELFTEDIDEVVVDDPIKYAYIKDLTVKVFGKKMSRMVTLHQSPTPIFEYYDVEEMIAKIFQRTVPLPSGGYLCVDETEALISIDVNTGSTKSQGNNAEVLLQTNIEAVDEVARQLRLRDIGGLVVIDFIDMQTYSHNDQVFKRMKEKLRNDRARTKVLPISALGLMQMTRQREQQSLRDRVYDPCPYCNGSGKVKSALSISVEIQRILKEILKRKMWVKDLTVRVIMNPSVLARLKNEDAMFLTELEDKYGKNLTFRADPSLHLEEFQIVDPETGQILNEQK